MGLAFNTTAGPLNGAHIPFDAGAYPGEVGRGDGFRIPFDTLDLNGATGRGSQSRVLFSAGGSVDTAGQVNQTGRIGQAGLGGVLPGLSDADGDMILENGRNNSGQRTAKPAPMTLGEPVGTSGSLLGEGLGIARQPGASGAGGDMPDTGPHKTNPVPNQQMPMVQAGQTGRGADTAGDPRGTSGAIGLAGTDGEGETPRNTGFPATTTAKSATLHAASSATTLAATQTQAPAHNPAPENAGHWEADKIMPLQRGDSFMENNLRSDSGTSFGGFDSFGSSDGTDSANGNNSTNGTVFNLSNLTAAKTEGVRIVNLMEGVARHVQVMQQKGDGTAKLQLKLEPEYLGEVTVKLSYSQGKLNAQFIAASHLAREAIDQALTQLRENLAQHNIQLDEASVSMGEKETPQFQEKGSAFSRKGFSSNDQQTGFGEPNTDDERTIAGRPADRMSKVNYLV